MTRRKGQNIPDDGPSEEDLERFSDVTRQCPECGATLYDEAEVCYKCGHAMTSETARPPWWIIGAAVAALIAFVWFVTR